jgi:N-acetylglucosaminyldiphosphoundecaprenol N-acetyl-beta-D-mannosaminyltransferase
MTRAAASVDPAGFTEAPFLGVQLARIDMQGAARLIEARSSGAPFAYVVTPNAQHFVLLDKGEDKLFCAAYARAWLRLCDSRVVRALAWLLFGEKLPLAAGSDLTAYLFEHIIRPDDPITVIGGNEELAARLKMRFGLINLHLYDPPMGFIKMPDAVERSIEFVHEHPARYVFLAVGAPSSEILAEQIAARPGTIGTGLCIGSSLRFLVGLAKRAPLFYRRVGLEWLYRLMMNPTGHAHRVFVQSFPLLVLMARTRLRTPLQ